MFQYIRGLGLIWVGLSPPTDNHNNIIWLRLPQTRESRPALYIYNVWAGQWETLISDFWKDLRDVHFRLQDNILQYFDPTTLEWIDVVDLSDIVSNGFTELTNPNANQILNEGIYLCKGLKTNFGSFPISKDQTSNAFNQNSSFFLFVTERSIASGLISVYQTAQFEDGIIWRALVKSNAGTIISAENWKGYNLSSFVNSWDINEIRVVTSTPTSYDDGILYIEVEEDAIGSTLDWIDGEPEDREVTFPSSGGIFTLNVVSNSTWNLKPFTGNNTTNWTISPLAPTAFTGNGQVIVAIPTNTTGTVLTMKFYLTFSSQQTSSKTLTITQES